MTSDRSTMLANLMHFAIVATITLCAAPTEPLFTGGPARAVTVPDEPYVPPERAPGPPPKRVNKGTRRSRKAAKKGIHK